MSNNTNILEVDSVEMNFGVSRLLSDVYLKCKQGEVTGLLGRNGSGKSTLLKIVFGALSAQSASIRINGQMIAGTQMKERLIGYLPQQHFIPANMKVSQALALFGVDQEVGCRALPELETMLSAKPGQLSGGERRLIEILLILNTRNLFCLLDEPFSGLSPVMIDRVAELIDLAKATKGILITDHLHRQVVKMSNSLYLLSNGRARYLTSANDLVRFGYVPGGSSL